jgi:pheromone alpha factor receptor
MSRNYSELGRKTFCSQSTFAGPLESFKDRKGSLAPISPSTIDSIVEAPPHAPRDSTELGLEAMGVRVDKSYSFHSGKGLVGN